jgi:RNA polymerase sigma-70 factor (ECF subfamily)
MMQHDQTAGGQAACPDTGAAPSNQDLNALVAEILAGDHIAFERLIAATQSELRAFLALRARDPDQVEDCLQASYVAALEGIARFRSGGSLIAWLKGIARNHLREDLRRRQRTLAMDHDALERLINERLQARLDGEDVPDEDERVQQRLRHCLARLGPRCRELLELRHIDDQGLEALSGRFQISTGAVASKLVRVRRGLRSCIQHRSVSEATR